MINPQNNTANLVNDLATGYVPGTLTQGSGTAANSQCSISGSGFTISRAGDTVTVTLPVSFAPIFAGPKTAYQYLTDMQGRVSNWQPIGTWTIPGAGPVHGAIVSTAPYPSYQAFGISATHTSGANELGLVMILFGSVLNGPGSCWVAVDTQNNTANLVNDAATGYVAGTLTPGSGSVSNSQCSIAGSNFILSKSGNTVMTYLPIAFANSFAGPKKVFQYLRGTNGQVLNWAQIGTWAPQP